jgi:hypothetical protein
LDHPAAAVLTGLDRLSSMLNTYEIATLAYVLLDVEAGVATIARAGHLPPVLIDPEDGLNRFVDILEREAAAHGDDLETMATEVLAAAASAERGSPASGPPWAARRNESLQTASKEPPFRSEGGLAQLPHDVQDLAQAAKSSGGRS